MNRPYVTQSAEGVLGGPVGLPSELPLERMISEITSIEHIRGDKTRRAVTVGGIGALAVVGGLLLFGGGSEPEVEALTPPPRPVEAASVTPAAAGETLPGNDNHLFAVTVDSKPMAAPAVKAEPEKQRIEREAAPAVLREPSGSGAKGTLEIETDPPVAVYLGDRRLGKTPLSTEVEAGTHELRFVSKRLHLDSKRTVKIQPGKTVKSEVYFGVSKLRLAGPDGAKVYLDGKLVGQLPLKTIRLVEGAHSLKVKHEGEVFTESLDVPPSRTIDLTVNF